MSPALAPQLDDEHTPITLPTLLRLAGPVMASRLGIMAMGLVDTVCVGRYSATELGFHALGWAPTGVVLVTAIGLLGGVQVVSSQLIGEGRAGETGAVLRRGLVYAFWLGIAVSLLIAGAGPWFLHHVGLAPALADGASPVMQVFAVSLLPILIADAGIFWLEAHGKPSRLGDSITTDHISPAGSIKADSPAGTFLQEHQVSRADFNSYGARRGNDEVMVRGTFANIRIKNEMVPGVEGGMSRYDGAVLPIYDVAMKFKADGVPMVIVAGKEYGTGSSRDWAAKGTNLLGVRAVIVESFERIHRSNLVGMGVLPLQFADGVTRQTLGLTGDETFTIRNVAGLRPRQDVEVELTRADGSTETFLTRCRIDTVNELEYFLNGGILQYVLRKLAA